METLKTRLESLKGFYDAHRDKLTAAEINLAAANRENLIGITKTAAETAKIKEEIMNWEKSVKSQGELLDVIFKLYKEEEAKVNKA